MTKKQMQETMFTRYIELKEMNELSRQIADNLASENKPNDGIKKLANEEWYAANVLERLAKEMFGCDFFDMYLETL